MMKIAQWQEMAARLDEMARASGDAEALLESLAAAVFPVERRDRAHLTWEEQLTRRAGDAVNGEGAASAEERLRAYELRFRALVEQIPAVTFMAVLGQGENEVYVSPHIEAMLGYTQEEWLADPFLWYRRLHPDDRELWNAEFARGCRSGGPFRAECRFIARDGHLVWVHGEARIVKDDRGRPSFLQGVAFDITESKRAQEVLLNEAVRSAKIEEELEIARRVQTSILPRDFRVEGLEIAAAMFPASEVGGDYYDVVPTADGAWLAIGDVSGHGLNSGLVMLMLQSAILALTRASPNATPRDVLCGANEVLYDNIRTRLGKDDHVTFTLLRYKADGEIVFAGAHEDILVRRRSTGRVECIRPPGTWLGARADVRRVTVDSLLHLADGDVMVLYTDGVTEARNARREQFDLQRLVAVVEACGDEVPAPAIRDRILDAVRAWMTEQSDDMSVVVARHRAPARKG
jgi:PAS domain S-box-containing protein